MKASKKFWSLLLALVMVVSLMSAAFVVSAADEAIAITPTATLGGKTVTMTATGLQDQFTLFDLGSLFGMPGAFGYTYAMWFNEGGTFSFSEDVTLTKGYFDSAMNQIGSDEVAVKAGEIIAIDDGVYSEFNSANIVWSEFYITLDDTSTWMIIDSAEPGNYSTSPANTALAEFPGTIADVVVEEPTEEPIEEPVEEPAEEPVEAPVEEEPVPVEEVPAEEPAEEPIEEPDEEPVVEVPVIEEPVVVEEPVVEAPVVIAPAPGEEAPVVIAPAPGAKTYTVVAGDCLWTICEKIYGDPFMWGKVFEANTGILTNPSLIYVGQVLVMP